MGYIAHDLAAIVFHDQDSDGLKKLEEWRKNLPPEYQKFILGPVTGVNGYTTVVFVPDGSKEGWEDSDDCERYRQEFLLFGEVRHSTKWSFRSGDAVMVRFGGDHGRAQVKHTDEESYE